MANDINKEDPHYKGEFGSIYEVNRKFPAGGVAGDFVVIEGWAHYWNADRGTWCVNAERDSYWDELMTNILEKFKLVRGATYMGVASLDTVPAKVIGAKMYYFATVAGTYKNFDNLVVPQGINVLYSENGSSWVNTTLLEVAQELGVSTNKVVSQKALNDALNLKANQSSVNDALAKKADKEEMNRLLATKANTADVNTKFTEEKKRVDAELDKKANAADVASKFTAEAARVNAELDKKANAKDVEQSFSEQATKNTEQDAEIAKKANSADVTSQMQTEQTRVNTELEKKFDKEDIAQEFGDSEDKVVSQLALPFREIESQEFLFSIIDKYEKQLFTINQDGFIDWGKGIPTPIKKKFNEVIYFISQELNSKVDKESGMSLIDDNIKAHFKIIENETFILAIVDSEDKVVAGILRDNGKLYILPTNEGYNKSISLIKSFLYVLCDKENKILETVDIDGLHIFYSGIKAFYAYLTDLTVGTLQFNDKDIIKQKSILEEIGISTSKSIYPCMMPDGDSLFSQEIDVSNIKLISLDGIISKHTLCLKFYDKYYNEIDMRDVYAGCPISIPAKSVGMRLFVEKNKISSKIKINILKFVNVEPYTKREVNKKGIEVYYSDFYDSTKTDSECMDILLEFCSSASQRTIHIDKDICIDKAILLPSHTTIYIENCTITQNNEVCDNVFRGSNIILKDDDIFYIPEESIEKIEDIHIIGVGTSYIVSPEKNRFYQFPNGTYKQLVGDWYGPRSHQIVFTFADNIEVKNINFLGSRGWTLSFDFVSNAEISNLRINTLNKKTYYNVPSENGKYLGAGGILNGDGINIRTGCFNIFIHDILGETWDDVLAINSWYNYDEFFDPTDPKAGKAVAGEYSYNIAKKLKTSNPQELNLHDIKVDNIVRSIGRSRMIILTPGNGRTFSNIYINNCVVDERSNTSYRTEDEIEGFIIMYSTSSGYFNNIFINNIVCHNTLLNIPVLYVNNNHARFSNVNANRIIQYNKKGIICNNSDNTIVKITNSKMM